MNLRAFRRIGLLAASTVGLGACGDGVLNPAGEEAHTIAGLWWWLFAVGAAVFVAVLVLLGVAVNRGNRHEVRPGGSDADATADLEVDPDDGSGDRFVVWGGIVFPSVILVVVMVAGVWLVRDLRSNGDDGALRIEVTAHQYWWDVVYPDTGVRTANELHLPVGRPVDLVLRSDDVIHSLWIPRLAGKLDLIPGHTTELRVEATEAGELSGLCAEFCGLQHTNMRILVTAHEPAEFESWLADRSGPAPAPDTDQAREGQQVFLSSCAQCHRVAGTDATRDIGPDLTHMASRPFLAGGALPNTRGDLGGWVLDPQHAKPGALMPPTRLEPAQLHALLTYLETLE